MAEFDSSAFVPEFGEIEAGDGRATADAIRLLYQQMVAVQERLSLTGGLPDPLPAVDGGALTNLNAGALTGTIPDAAFPATLPATVTKLTTGIQVGSGVKFISSRIVLNAAQTNSMGGPFTGFIFLTRDDNTNGAILYAKQVDATVQEIYDPANQFGQAAGASAINVYWNGGDLEIQNNLGATEPVSWVIFAMSP